MIFFQCLPLPVESMKPSEPEAVKLFESIPPIEIKEKPMEIKDEPLDEFHDASHDQANVSEISTTIPNILWKKKNYLIHFTSGTLAWRVMF